LHRHTTYIDSAGIPYFSEVGQLAGISNTDWSWAPLMADFDNDGLKDIFITNGIKRDFRNKDFYNSMQEYKQKNPDALSNPEKITYLIESTPHRPYKNYFYRNTGSFHFENTSEIWLENSPETYSNGAAYADLDNDGDLDLVINNVDQEALILENTANTKGNHFLHLAFKGAPGNIDGLGVKVEAYTSSGLQIFENYQVRGYQSSVQPGIHIGLGNQTRIDSLRIIWPGAQTQVLTNVSADQTLEIQYQGAELTPYHRKHTDQQFFSKTQLNIPIIHQENEYDDYQEQVLLPHKMSQFGPAIAVGDINGDGRDDLYVGQSTGSPSRLYAQQTNGDFKEIQAFEEDAAYEDIDAAFLDMDKDGDLDLYVASGGNEFPENDPHYKDRLYENVKGRFIHRPDLLPDNLSISSSRVKVEDYDGDGYPDIFVGGRHVPHHYPAPASSYLLHNNHGSFENISTEMAPDLESVGLVTDAAWFDFDGDGDSDLCIVGEWMAPLLLENKDGKFEKVAQPSSEKLTGWYYSVTAHDADGDGDLDLLLGNLGENYKYKANAEEPFEVYYGDFDENGKK
ncbi:MAG: VCBS repeat-containing protein, partial [Bacteroidetes bacterium]|nr:VCBS repeat-containing protein [Bacteroidota bacterium]